MSKADTPLSLSPNAQEVRNLAMKLGGEWLDKNNELVQKMAALKWDHTLAIALYIEAFEAGRATLQSTLDRLSEPGEGCRGCGGIIGPYCVECGEAAAQQQAGSPKKKSEE